MSSLAVDENLTCSNQSNNLTLSNTSAESRSDQLPDIYRVSSIFSTHALIRSSHFGDQVPDTPGVRNALGLETGRRSSVVMSNPSQEAGLTTIDSFSEILNPEYTNAVYQGDAFDFGLDRLVTNDISLPSVFERDLTTSSLSINGSDWIQPVYLGPNETLQENVMQGIEFPHIPQQMDLSAILHGIETNNVEAGESSATDGFNENMLFEFSAEDETSGIWDTIDYQNITPKSNYCPMRLDDQPNTSLFREERLTEPERNHCFISSNIHSSYTPVAKQTTISTTGVDQSTMTDVDACALSEQRGPMSRSNRWILPAKRRGRKGAMSEAQRNQRKTSKAAGVCFRCRKSGVKCSGGIPCTACLRNSKAKLWNVPCVKAGFLDMVKFGPYFPYGFAYQQTRFESENSWSIFGQMHIMSSLTQQPCPVLIATPQCLKSCILPCFIPWIFGFAAMGEATADSAQHKSALPPQLAKGFKGTEGPDREIPLVFFGPPDKCSQEDWFARAILFCTLAPYSFVVSPETELPTIRVGIENISLERVSDSMVWLAMRHIELKLFHYLQRVSNETSFEENSEHHAYIICLLQTLIAIPSMSDLVVKHFSLDFEDDKTKTSFSQFEDRTNRIRTALWVNASIAIWKLRDSSSFWETASKQLAIHPKKLLCQHLDGSLAKLDRLIGDAAREVMHSMRKFSDFTASITQLYPELGQGEDKRSDDGDLDSIQELRKRLYHGKIDDYIQEIDKRLSGGLLSAKNQEQQAHFSTKIFFLFASVDWVACISEPEDEETLNQATYRLLKNLIGQRLLAIKLFDIKKAVVDTLVANGRSVDCKTPLTDLIRYSDELTGTETEHLMILLSARDESLRQGGRWSQLSSLFGVEIVFLTGLFLPNSSKETRMPNITKIILSGSDDDFTRLVNMMVTKCQWIGDTCKSLKGVLQLIMEAESLKEKALNKALELAKQINERARTIFGSLSKVEEIGGQESKKLCAPLGLLFDMFVVLFNDCRGTRETRGDGMDQFDQRPIPRFRRHAIESFLDVVKGVENLDFSDRNRRKSLFERWGQTLNQTVGNFLRDCGSGLDNYGGQNDGQSKKSWLLKGVDAYIGAVRILLLEGGTELEDRWNEALKLLNDGKKALCIAFQ